MDRAIGITLLSMYFFVDCSGGSCWVIHEIKEKRYGQTFRANAIPVNFGNFNQRYWNGLFCSASVPTAVTFVTGHGNIWIPVFIGAAGKHIIKTCVIITYGYRTINFIWLRNLGTCSGKSLLGVACRLSLLVAFSCAFGFTLASPSLNWVTLSMVFLGGFLLSGASIAINQVIEKDFDKLMTRTMNRPLPTGRVTVREAIIFAALCAVLSIYILFRFTNPLTVSLSIVSMLLYSFAYTPLKRVGSIALLSHTAHCHHFWVG